MARPASAIPVSFATFYQRWGDHVGWTVPDVHLLACDWLQHGRTGRVGVLKGFRGLSKSTIVGRYVAWKLRADGRYRFMTMSATDADSAKMSADAQHVIQGHPWCGHLRPKKGLWQTHRFSLEEADDPRNPNVAAFGVLSNVTGGRADEVIFDDVEVPKTIRTPSLRESLRHRLGDTTHILVPGGKKLYIGTDHCPDSIYKEQIERGADLLEIPLFSREVTHEARGLETDYLFAWRTVKPDEIHVAVGECSPTLLPADSYDVWGLREPQGFVRLEKPLPPGTRVTIYAGNQWPTRFDRAEVAFRMDECRTWGEFDSQYQLKPAQLTKVRLNPARLIPYTGEPEFRKVNGEVLCLLDGRRMVGVSAYWDCSLGKKKSDASAISILFADADGHYYWHRASAFLGEIDEQCMAAIPLIQQLRLPGLAVETNGPGGFVPAILTRHLKARRVPCAVTPRWRTCNKNTFILEMVEPLLSGGYLHASEQVMASPAIAQLREWDPTIADQPDDYLDSCAGAIAETPVRIGSGMAALDPSPDAFRPGGGQYTAAADY